VRYMEAHQALHRGHRQLEHLLVLPRPRSRSLGFSGLRRTPLHGFEELLNLVGPSSR